MYDRFYSCGCTFLKNFSQNFGEKIFECIFVYIVLISKCDQDYFKDSLQLSWRLHSWYCVHSQLFSLIYASYLFVQRLGNKDTQGIPQEPFKWHFLSTRQMLLNELCSFSKREYSFDDSFTCKIQVYAFSVP